LLFLFKVLTVPSVAAQENCELKKISKGVAVYTCERSDSELNAIRALFEVNATLSQYAATVLNINEYKHWNYEAKNARIMKQISDTELIYYTESFTPWPIMNRYVVLRLKVTQDPKSKILRITIDDIPDIIPEQTGFVMVEEFQAVLHVKPNSDGILKVELDLNVDPGGSLPVWLTNIITTKIPVNTYSNLRERVEAFPDADPIFSAICN
jgi:hypothetical protein